MKLLKFELLKIWKQKKILWMVLFVFLASGAIYWQHASQQEFIKERVQEKVEVYKGEADKIYGELSLLQKDGLLTESQEKQFTVINQMATSLFNWSSAIYNEEWAAIPDIEYDFLTHLLAFEESGGQFTQLTGIEKEIAIEKNEWLRTHGLPYEDEMYGLSPHILLVNNSTWLFGIAGILILVLLFGNTLVNEKEQKTWLTLSTQPIKKAKLIAGKYSSLVVMMVLFIVLVVGAGLLLPFILNNLPMQWQYPVLTRTAESFEFLSTYQYMTRSLILFICAAIFIFSLVLFISKWVGNSFSMLLLTAFLFIIGVVATDVYVALQVAVNPFNYFRFSDLLTSTPSSSDWLYPVMTVIWSTLLILLTIYLSDKNTNLLFSQEVKRPFKKGMTLAKASRLWSVMIFEWRKLQRKGLLRQSVFMLVLLIVIGYLGLTQWTHEKEKAYVENLEKSSESMIIPFFEEQIAEFEDNKQLAIDAENESEAANFQYLIEESQKALAFLKEQSSKIQNAVIGLQNKDWDSFYEYQLFENQFANGEYESGNFFSGVMDDIGKFTIDVSIEEKHWLMEHNIEPVFGGEYLPTIYIHFKDDDAKEFWLEQNHKVDNSGLFSVYSFFENYLYVIPTLLFLFLMGSGLSSERGKKQTIRMLQTQPLSKRSLFLGKVLSGVLVSLGSFIGIYGFILLLGTVYDQFGDWNYPILHYNSNSLLESATYEGLRSMGNGYHFVPLGEFLIETIILSLFIVLFVIVLSNFLSLFLKNQFTVMALTILLLVGGHYVSMEMLSDWAHLIPFTYFDIPRVVNGEISTLLDKPSLNYTTGILVFSISALVIVLIGLLISKKQRFNLRNNDETISMTKNM